MDKIAERKTKFPRQDVQNVFCQEFQCVGEKSFEAKDVIDTGNKKFRGVFDQLF